MPDEAFGVVEPNPGNPGKDLTQGFAFLVVPAGRPGRMGADDLDLFGAQATAGKGQANALGLAFGVWEHKVCRIGVDRVGHDLGDDVGRAFFGIGKTLQNVQTATFGYDDPTAVLVERPGSFRRVAVAC